MRPCVFASVGVCLCVCAFVNAYGTTVNAYVNVQTSWKMMSSINVYRYTVYIHANIDVHTCGEKKNEPMQGWPL